MKSLYNILKINTLNLSIVSLLFLASCSSTQYTSNNDDVYYSRKNKEVTKSVPVTNNNQLNNDNTEQVVNVEPSNSGSNSSNYNSKFDQNQNVSSNDSIPPKTSYSNSETYTDENGTTYVTNNYFDDYYDYEYASRLRRFHNPNYGYNYYDDYYTNMYWYTYNPYYWGTSIYMGYNWYYPNYCYFRPGWNWSFGIGYGYPYGYYSWDPFYYSYYPYWYGYYPYYGYHDYAYYYYNSHDRNGSNYYHSGGRGPLSSYSSRHANRGNTYTDNSNAKSFGEKYNSIIASQNNNMLKPASGALKSENNVSNQPVNTVIKKGTLNDNSQGVINTTNKGSANSLAPATNSPLPKPTTIDNNISKPGLNTVNSNPVQNSNVNSLDRTPKIIEPNQKQAYKFNKPENMQQYKKPVMNNNYNRPVQKYAKPKTYMSPGYSQPKSGQYYSKPNNNSMPKQERGYNREQNYNFNSGGSRQIENSTPKYDRGNQGNVRSYPSPSPQQHSSPSPSIQQRPSSPSPSRSNGSMNSSGGSSRSSESRSAPSSGGSNGGGRRR